MIVIIGAGPCGLGAALRLQEAGFDDFLVFEASHHPGGLASSFKDDQGFLWDIGGHVQFSHYEDFDRVMDAALPDGWYFHERESWIWMRDRFIPYPFQLNLWRLPEAERDACVKGLEKLPEELKLENFETWIKASFGEGIAESFMLPYNFKVWAHDLKKMSYQWIGERVATVDLSKLKENLKNNRDEVSWGPNSKFRYPKEGGTGAIWAAVSKMLPPDKVRLGQKLVKIDPQKRELIFENGVKQAYDKVLSTIPIDRVFKLSGLGEPPRFLSSDSHIVGLGFEGPVPRNLETKCWLYFPEMNCPFYRITVFSNYSPAHVPQPSRQWSLMCETAESDEKHVNTETIVEDTIRGLSESGFLKNLPPIVSRWHFVARPGYPTPFLNRDCQVEKLRRELEAHQIYPRGRFGLWKYEVSNQDHTFMQGFEWADHILFGEEELTMKRPDLINRGEKQGIRTLKRYAVPSV